MSGIVRWQTAMVVDDDPLFRRSLVRLLTRHDLEVTEATSCPEAVRALERGLPDLIFVDLEMPGARGDRLVGALRQLRKNLPIVVCSGTANRDDLVTLVHAGMSDFLEKPFGRAELDACLERLATRSRPEPEATTALTLEPDHPLRESPPVEDPVDLLRKAVGAEECIPAMAPCLGQVQELMAQPECGVHEVRAVLESDPSVVSTLLRTASSPSFGAARAPRTTHDACVVLGNRTALCIAHEAFVQSLSMKTGPFADLGRRTWRNATATAHAARLLAAEQEGTLPETAYLIGLFHNIGDPVLLQAADRLRRQGVPLGTGEVQEVSVALHEELGARLARKWSLPLLVATVASSHHGEPGPLVDRTTRRYLDLTRTAHCLATRWVGPGLHPASEPPIPPEELDHLDDRLRDAVLSLLV